MPDPDTQAAFPIPLAPDAATDQPVFAEPWHAQLFALTVKLSEAGHFAWPEWAAHFGAMAERASDAGAPKDGSAYYDVWLAALEDLLVVRGLASKGGLADRKQAWTEAYLKTPHGQPAQLRPGSENP